LSSGCDDPSMTFQYPVEIARDLVSMTSQFSHQSMEVHGIGLIEKLFDVACSLTDVLSLLPPNSDPFSLGPRDYLHQFMTLLSVLRNGDSRFLPLLLSKVHDVLPKLANPMLQTVPNTPNNMCADVDIFDGFGNAGMGVPAPNMSMNNGVEFKMENVSMSPFDKRIEDLGPAVEDSSSNGSPFTSPPIITSGMEFPDLGNYGGFPELGNSGMGGNPNGVPEFKREFEGNLGLVQNGVRRPPLRQSSASSFGMQIPRSIPEFHHLQRADSRGEGVDMGMGGIEGLPFR